MAEIPDRLRCLFSTTLERRGDSYVFEVPREELDEGEVTSSETYRVAVLSRTESRAGQTDDDGPQQRHVSESGERAPPVKEGEVRAVEIESVGDQGDGIAKVERGYVLIVPGAHPGDEPTVEIESVRENVAFAKIVDESVPVSDQEDNSGTQGGLASQPSTLEGSETR